MGKPSRPTAARRSEMVNQDGRKALDWAAKVETDGVEEGCLVAVEVVAVCRGVSAGTQLPQIVYSSIANCSVEVAATRGVRRRRARPRVGAAIVRLGFEGRAGLMRCSGLRGYKVKYSSTVGLLGGGKGTEVLC